MPGQRNGRHKPQQQRPAQHAAAPAPQQQFSADDHLPSAPPAFPQPVSSLPQQPYLRQPLPLSSAAAGQLPQQQPPPAHWGPAALNGGAAAASGQAAALAGGHTLVLLGGGPSPSGSLPLPPPVLGAYAPSPLDGSLPYDAVAAAYGSGAYADDGSVPLLSGGSFVADMVFANRQVRHALVRRALGIITLQLLATAALGVALTLRKDVRRFLHQNPWALVLAGIVTGTVLLLMACSESARRRHPSNLLLLAAFTCAAGLLAGTASATYATQVPILGLLIAAVVSLALIAYASQAALEFSAPGGILLSALVVLLAVSLAEGYLGFKTLHLLIAGCGALLFAGYLVVDLQLLASGESAYQVCADEALFCALNVLSDGITLALHVLRHVSRACGPAE